MQPCRITRIVKAQVDVFVHGSRQAVFHHLHGEAAQVAGLFGHRCAAAFCACQSQQLVHGVGCANAGAANVVQRLLQIIGIGVFAQGQVSLHAQTRQRCFQLVRGVSQKAFLGGDGVLQALQQIVDG